MDQIDDLVLGDPSRNAEREEEPGDSTKRTLVGMELFRNLVAPAFTTTAAVPETSSMGEGPAVKRPHSFVGYYTAPDGEKQEIKFIDGCPFGDVWGYGAQSSSALDLFPPDEAQIYSKIFEALGRMGYHITQRVFRGNFADVYSAYSDSHKHHAAIKILLAKSQKRKGRKTVSAYIPEEINIMKELTHPNVVRLLDYTNEQNHICMVLEWCDVGDMYDLLHKQNAFFLSEQLTLVYFRQLMDAVYYIHSCYIVHRDIKCRNLLIDSNNKLKLCDFGMSRKVQHLNEEAVGVSGTPGYRCPEILDDQPYILRKADIWALGVVLYIMLVGRPPFGEGGSQIALNRIKQGFEIPQVLKLSDDVLVLLKGILCPNPANRYTVNRIINSPWLKESVGITMIGNYYLSQKQKKLKGSHQELIAKNEWGI